jgi:hypothetical protein
MENEPAMDPHDVENILAGAVKAVADAKVPDDLKSLAFEKAVDLLAGRAAASSPPPVLAAPTAASTSPAATAASQLDRLSSRLGLPRDVVESVYAEGKDGLHVNVKPDRLPRSKSAGARELAMLVAAMHQAESDEPTSADQIRHVVEDYNRYDQPNFASSLAALKGPFLVVGPSRARTFKLTRPGWAEAAKLVARFAGEE